MSSEQNSSFKEIGGKLVQRGLQEVTESKRPVHALLRPCKTISGFRMLKPVAVPHRRRAVRRPPMKAPVLDALDRGFDLEDVDIAAPIGREVLVDVRSAELKDRAGQERLYPEDGVRLTMNFREIVGESPALLRTLQEVETVAPTDSTVLIYGETGTGKELVARAIHERSARAPYAFITLNCAAIPGGLLESELVGHEKGAFTGAISQRIGRFERANGGTIFLDEIGEIPLDMQPKLLRVLQEREFERLGNARTLRTDARLIAATNRDLAAMVEEKNFRADLFYRLNVFPVRVPPLRERPEDIPLLARHFAEQF